MAALAETKLSTGRAINGWGKWAGNHRIRQNPRGGTQNVKRKIIVCVHNRPVLVLGSRNHLTQRVQMRNTWREAAALGLADGDTAHPRGHLGEGGVLRRERAQNSK